MLKPNAFGASKEPPEMTKCMNGPGAREYSLQNTISAECPARHNHAQSLIRGSSVARAQCEKTEFTSYLNYFGIFTIEPKIAFRYVNQIINVVVNVVLVGRAAVEGKSENEFGILGQLLCCWGFDTSNSLHSILFSRISYGRAIKCVRWLLFKSNVTLASNAFIISHCTLEMWFYMSPGDVVIAKMKSIQCPPEQSE